MPTSTKKDVWRVIIWYKVKQRTSEKFLYNTNNLSNIDKILKKLCPVEDVIEITIQHKNDKRKE